MNVSLRVTSVKKKPYPIVFSSSTTFGAPFLLMHCRAFPRIAYGSWQGAQCAPCYTGLPGLYKCTMKHFCSGVLMYRNTLYSLQAHVLSILETSKYFKMLDKIDTHTYGINYANIINWLFDDFL